MNTKTKSGIEAFETLIGYKFKNREILERALTHSSFNREQNTKHKDNERLEFLGDAFLDAIISVELFEKMKNVTEGRLTKTRALVVCEEALAEAARKLELGRYMLMGHGEDRQGGRTKNSILADCIEAVIGAIFLDGGYAEADRFVRELLAETTEKAISGELFKDYKSELQEVLQSSGKQINIVYVTDREEGPAHDKKFYIHMECNGETYGSGTGSSKKAAEQEAAKRSLEMISEQQPETGGK